MFSPVVAKCSHRSVRRPTLNVSRLNEISSWTKKLMPFEKVSCGPVAAWKSRS